jgi:hypothetical protein
MSDEVLVVFQDCINSLEIVSGSDSEMFRDGNQFIHIKVEEVAGIQEEMEVEDPLEITFPVMETEPEVSFMSLSILRHISLISVPAYFFCCVHPNTVHCLFFF